MDWLELCGVEKPISDFSSSGKSVLVDGSVVQRYKSTCKQCINTGPRKRKDNIDPKQCIGCGIIKPLSDFCFYKNRNGENEEGADEEQVSGE